MKIFGIGLSKTGTTSLTKALETLGFRATHSGRTFLEGEPAEYEAWDAATDELATAYAELDRRYPGSKFVLTVREPKGWLNSCSHHFRRPLPEDDWVGRMLVEIYGTTVFDAEKFLSGYQRHESRVRDYFKNRPNDLLVLDICSGDGYGPLCKYLNRPLPDEANFPRENVGRSLSRFTRKLRRLWGGASGEK